MFARSKPATPPEILADYVRLFNIAQVLDPADVDDMARRWAKISRTEWYETVANDANRLAVKHGRLTPDGIVTGALTDPEHGQIVLLADAVPGGGAIDVATAVLVRDLLPLVSYRKLTNWWSRHESTWLPGDPEPEPEPEQPPAGEPEPDPAPAPARAPRRTGADVTSAGALPIDVTEHPILPDKADAPTSPAGPPRPAPRGRTPRPRGPFIDPPREQVLGTAAERALAKTRRERRAMWARARGLLLTVFASTFCLYAIGDQFGWQLLPPASIGSLGNGWGRLACALFWAAIAFGCIKVAAGQYRLAVAIGRGQA
jgi:hypothetical protein